MYKKIKYRKCLWLFTEFVTGKIESRRFIADRSIDISIGFEYEFRDKGEFEGRENLN
jgi:hypothetical protein